MTLEGKVFDPNADPTAGTIATVGAPDRADPGQLEIKPANAATES